MAELVSSFEGGLTILHANRFCSNWTRGDVSDRTNPFDNKGAQGFYNSKEHT
jgi:hypothetical protein